MKKTGVRVCSASFHAALCPGHDAERIATLKGRLDHQKQIGVAVIVAARGDHGVGLTAMMGLVIEEMCHRKLRG